MLFLKKVKSLSLALWSLFWYGTVSAETHETRRAECFKCEAIISNERGIYCGACGCSQWWLSDLRKKWRMRELKCPLGKW